MKPKIVKMKSRLDAAEFLVPIQDHRGHSSQVVFRVPPEMKRAISIVLAKAPETGWLTSSDFWRWAARHGLQYIESKIKDSELSNMNRRITAMRDILVEEAALVEFRQVFELAAKTIQKLEDDNPREVMPTLMKLKEQIDDMDDPSWRQSWQKKFQAQFGHYLKREREEK
jgi:hypothetical protein